MLTEALANFTTFLMELEFKYKKIDFVDFYYHLKKLWSKEDAIDDALNRVHSNNQHVLRDLFYQEFSKIPKKRRDVFLKLFLSSVIDYFRKKDKFIAGFIDMNNQCNMSCNNCINSNLNHQDDMTWDKTKTNQILEVVKKLTRFIYITGGEPFLNPLLSEIIKEHPELLFLTFTNGTMTSEYQRVIDNKSDNAIFIVSVDGNMKDHELKRGIGSYNKAIETIKMLRSNGYFCGISTVVNPTNLEYVLKNDYLQELKEKSDVSFLYYLKEASDNEIKFIRRYFELSEEMKKHIGAPIPTFNMPYGEIVSENKACMSGDSIFHIAVDGTVTSCPFLFDNCGDILIDNTDTIVSNLKNSEHGCDYQKKLLMCK